MCILKIGNEQDGYQFIGPFQSNAQAVCWVIAHAREQNWSLQPVINP